MKHGLPTTMLLWTRTNKASKSVSNPGFDEQESFVLYLVRRGIIYCQPNYSYHIKYLTLIVVHQTTRSFEGSFSTGRA